MYEFLNRFEFFRYANALNLRPVQRPKCITYLICAIALTYYLLFSSLSHGAGGIAMILVFLSMILTLASWAVSLGNTVKPSPAWLMPISYKRKCVYDFLSAIYFAVLAVIVIIVAILVIALISIIIAAISGTLDTGSDGDYEHGSFAYPMGVHGALFAVAFNIITFSGGLMCGYIKKRAYRNGFSIGFACAIVLGIVLTGLPAYAVLIKHGYYGTRALLSPLTCVCYEYMNLPWLATSLWLVAAVAMFAATAYMCYRHHKPRQF